MISIIIRTYNESKFIKNLLTMISMQDINIKYEVIIVDSESIDKTVELAKKFSFVKIISIRKKDFSYGYAMNIGISNAKGKVIVAISGHCEPVDIYWLHNLTKPIIEKDYLISYGRQIGSENSRSSELTVFKNYFPNSDNPKYKYPNNANCAYSKLVFQKYKFDIKLIALEDLQLSTYFSRRKIFYCRKACVYHIHEETNAKVFLRFFREAYVYNKHFKYLNFQIYNFNYLSLVFILRDFILDIKTVFLKGKLFRSFLGLIGFRISQYYGLYLGQKIEIIKDYKIHNWMLKVLTKNEYNIKKLLRMLEF